jgi:hypothetical protein
MVCAGNSFEYCGGPSLLNVYNYTGTPPPPPGGAVAVAVAEGPFPQSRRAFQHRGLMVDAGCEYYIRCLAIFTIDRY